MQMAAVAILLLGAVAYLTLLFVQKSRARKHGACARCAQHQAMPTDSTSKAVAPDVHA
jgi:hypothetical protein